MSTDLLGIGASGLRVYQTALTTTSDNIANAGSAGYSRRTTDVRALTVPGTTASITGLGATVAGVNRASDGFRVAEVRHASTELAKTEVGIGWLERVESALTGHRLDERLTGFFNAAKAVAADPSASAPRTAMLESGAGLAAAFTGTADALAAAGADLEGAAQAAADQLTDLATSLAQVNNGLGRTRSGTSGHASLLDERDRLLEAMSAISDIAVDFDSFGRVAVRGGDASGPLLVQGDAPARVTVARNDEGALSISVFRAGNTSALVPSAGAFAGIAEGAQRIAAAQAEIDALATDFVDAVNTLQAEGRDLAGNSGAPFFAAGDPPARVTLALTDPATIAAALPGEGVRGNGNLAAFEALRTSGGHEARLTELITANASALAARRNVAQAQGAIRDSAIAARDAASGVSLDEEAVDLIRFQQAFQASGRVIQVARETIDAILNIR